MEKILYEVPDGLLQLQDDIQARISNNMGYYNSLLHVTCEIMVKTKLLCIALMLLIKEPLFTEGMSLDQTSIRELLRMQRELDFERISDCEFAFKAYCEHIMYNLCMFGWEQKEELFFSEEDQSHATYKDTHLSVYGDYFDELIQEEEDEHIESTVYTFVNARLGKYMEYVNTHDIDSWLRAQINYELSEITGLFGVDFSVSSLREYGYEVIYVYKNDDNDYGNPFYENTDFLVPIHAANLEKLLDKAYELYPIESEGEI